MHWRRKWQPTPVVLDWRIPGTGEPGGLLSMGSHRVGHDWSNLAEAAAKIWTGHHFRTQCACVCEVAQSCPTLWDPVDCSPPGSSVHGILQARILEWVAISFLKKVQKSKPLHFHFMDWWWFALKDRQNHSKMHQNPLLNPPSHKWLMEKSSWKLFWPMQEQLLKKIRRIWMKILTKWEVCNWLLKKMQDGSRMQELKEQEEMPENSKCIRWTHKVVERL